MYVWRSSMNILEQSFIVETGSQKLERLGRTTVTSGASVHGAQQVLPVTYRASMYKVDERFAITQEVPHDFGYGFIFSNVNHTEV